MQDAELATWIQRADLATKIAGVLGFVMGIVSLAILVSKHFRDKKAIQQEFEETVERMKTLDKNYELFQVQQQEDKNRAQIIYQRECSAMRAKMAAQNVDVNTCAAVTDGPHLFELRKTETDLNIAVRDEKHRYEREKEELQVKLRGLERRF